MEKADLQNRQETDTLSNHTSQLTKMERDTINCHSCSMAYKLPKVARCRNPQCGEAFCRKCLSGRYKYSKKSAKQLPTSTWRCPKCTNKCLCKKYNSFKHLL